MSEGRRPHIFYRHEEVHQETIDVTSVYDGRAAYEYSDYQTGSRFKGNTVYQTLLGSNAGNFYQTGSGNTASHISLTGFDADRSDSLPVHGRNTGYQQDQSDDYDRAYALYEKHEVKKDPENGRRHKIEEEVAAVAVVGGGGYAFHEYHEKKQDKEEAEKAGALRKQRHPLF